LQRKEELDVLLRWINPPGAIAARATAGLRFALFPGGYEPDICAGEPIVAEFASFAELHRPQSIALTSDRRVPQARMMD
jgi:hypothetical protein